MPEPITAIVIKGVSDQPAGTNPVLDGTIAVTPDHMPNVVTKVITPLVALLIRFGFMFFTSLAGTLTGAGVSGQTIIPWTDFTQLIEKAALLALTIALVDLVKNIATLFTKLEQTHPLMSGSV